MIVERYNSSCHVVSVTAVEETWLDESMGFPNERARHDPTVAERTPLYNPIAKTFPAGLLPILQRDAFKERIQIQVLDRRMRPCQVTGYDIGWLDDFQQEAVEKTLRSERGVFHGSTGMGKTEIIIAISALYRCNWVCFVPSKALVKQTADRFEKRTGEKAGMFGDGHRVFRRFTVATYASVVRALSKNDEQVKRWLKSLGGVHADEAHTVPSNTFWKTIMHCRGAFYRYGFSATPYARMDQKSILLTAAIGPSIYQISAPELVELGAVARNRVRLIAHRTHQSRHWKYPDAYVHSIVESVSRNRLIVRVAKLSEKPAILFVKAVNHGRILEKLLNQYGIKSEFVWGKKKSPMRDAAIRRLRHGDIDVIVANVVMQAGVDVPELASVINGAGNKSHIATVQQSGRGMRRRDSDGNIVKDEFTTYDIQDLHCGCMRHVHKIGRDVYTHRTCKWLDEHSKERVQAYLGEGYEVVNVSPDTLP